MSDQILIAVIGLIQAVCVSMIGVLIAKVGKVGRDSRATRAQVENDHSTNLRDDNDEKHNELVARLSRIWDVINNTLEDVGGIRVDIRALRTDHTALSGRVTELEKLEITGDKHG